MSRHRIPGHNPQHEVYVGWDRPLLTYFGQVYDRSIKDEDDQLIHWVGADRIRQLYEINDLARAMRKYATISQDMRTTLYGDKDEGR